MKVYFLALLFFVSSCASNQNLDDDKSCNVWEEQSFLGPRSISVSENKAHWQGNCRLFFVWWCDWVKADMPEGQDGIFLDGNGLFNNRKIVSRLKDEVMTYESTFLDSIVKSSPLQIDLKSKKTKRSVTTFIGNMQADEELNFSRACTAREVAVGAVALNALKNRK